MNKIIYCEKDPGFYGCTQGRSYSNCEALCGLVREKDCEGPSFIRDKLFIRIKIKIGAAYESAGSTAAE